MAKTYLKLLALIMCILIPLSVFSGCSKSGEAIAKNMKDNSFGTKSGSEKIKLKFFMRDASIISETSALVDKYNKVNNDNVEIEFEMYGENYKNIINSSLQSGDPPDIFELNGGLSIPKLAEAGYIMPIDKYINDNFKQNFYPEVFIQKQFYYRGKLYAIPERAAYFRLMYNKDIFKLAGISEPPKTLEELKADAEKITRIGNGKFYGYGAALKTTSSWGRFTDNICAIAGLTGDNGFDWKAGQFDFTKQKRALEFLISLQNEKLLYPNAINLDIEVARTLFGQGKFAMMIDGNWMVAHFGNKEIKCDVDWDSAPIPVFEGEKKGKDYMYFDMGKVIAARTPYPDESWNFIKFLLDNQKEFVKAGEPLRTLIKANDEANIPFNYKGIKNFIDIQNNRVFPMQVQDSVYIEGDNRDTTYTNIFINGGIGIDKELADLTRRYNSALNKAIESGKIKLEDIKIPYFNYFER